jgi:hypothetical protein
MLMILLYPLLQGRAQSSFQSETIIKYNLKKQTTDVPIPFHKPFTIEVDSLSPKNILFVSVYEAQIRNGQRSLVTNTFTDCGGGPATAAIEDMRVGHNTTGKSLTLYMPPLKANKSFDINIVYKLPASHKKALMAVNEQLRLGSVANATPLYNAFRVSTMNPETHRSYTSNNFNDYQAFYNANLSVPYTFAVTAANFTTASVLTEPQIQAIDIAGNRRMTDFSDSYYLIEAAKRNLFDELLMGYLKIEDVYGDPARWATLQQPIERLANLESNLKYFDSVLKRIDRHIARGITTQMVAGTNVNMQAVQAAVYNLYAECQQNTTRLKSRLEAIDEAIDLDAGFAMGIYLVGNTVSSDLKTKGGNVLFMDAGFANIFAPDVHDDLVYIPRLYLGVSIYFTPIDKNTRRQKLPGRNAPEAFDGCHVDPLDGITKYGPDYEILARRSIWQHLCLNVGLTLGKMTQNGFDNFYNDNSLLVGPAYRFARAFKISAGAAFMKRDSKNPLDSNKSVVTGGYISVSADIDFLQSINDIKTLLFK